MGASPSEERATERFGLDPVVSGGRKALVRVERGRGLAVRIVPAPFWSPGPWEKARRGFPEPVISMGEGSLGAVTPR